MNFMSLFVMLLAFGTASVPGHVASDPMGAEPAIAPMAFPEFLRSFLDLAPDASRTAYVQDITLERDGAVFTFASGDITLLEPIGDRTVGAVFVGQATFEFQPSSDVERD